MMKCYLFFVSLFSLVSTAHATPPSTHCKIQESVVFNCKMGNKTLSVCENDQRVQYRFGETENIELALPEDIDEQQRISYATKLLGAGEINYYRFAYQHADYVVYSGDFRGKLQAGVLILNNNMTQHNLTCDSYTAFDASFSTGFSPKGKIREESSNESLFINAFSAQ